MKISTSKLKCSVDYYEKIFLNLKKTFLDIENNWFGQSNKLFFKKIYEEQLKIEKNVIELRDIISVYNYCIQEYSTIGKKIYFDLESFDKLNNYANNCIDILSNIIFEYDNVPSKFNYLVESQLKYFRQCYDDFIIIKQRVKNICERIKNLENVINSKLSKMNIEILKESDYEGLV